MLKPSIKLNKDLWIKIKQCAEAGGYSSPQEFIQHVLEREIARLTDEAESKEEIERKLKGLGYLE